MGALQRKSLGDTIARQSIAFNMESEIHSGDDGI